ncbi:MAG: N-acetylneuraminate synthase [Patescibacteria group bacterium]|nr:N-acetylneuraminate synthase [Patescibacteria group bacterium]
MAIKIEKKEISDKAPVFIIAEAGVNHNGDINLAKKLIDVAVTSGADAVKFQTFTAELIVTETAEQAAYQSRNIGKTETQYKMLKRLELSEQDHYVLRDYCEEKNIIFLSTPFSEKDADFLETVGVPAYKTSSGEITNLPFLEHIAKKGKPIILASGMSSLEELRAAALVIKKAGNRDLVILHCTSNYPADPKSLNLRAIKTIKNEFGALAGYSDHSEGNLASLLAVALGACVIEKHFTLDKAMAGPDHKASLNPEELKNFVKSIRQAEVMLGSFEKKCSPEEENSKIFGRKSIVAAKDITAGAAITRNDLIMKRPGSGISPAEINSVIGKSAKINILKDKIIIWEMIK